MKESRFLEKVIKDLITLEATIFHSTSPVSEIPYAVRHQLELLSNVINRVNNKIVRNREGKN